MTASDGDSAQATMAHEEYLDEVQRLVVDQVRALFARLAAAVQEAATGHDNISVKQDDRSFTATAGERMLTCRVETVVDLPEGADRAKAFPSGQAEAIVHLADGSTAAWELQRYDAAGASGYAWVRADTRRPITNDDVAAVVRSLFT